MSLFSLLKNLPTEDRDTGWVGRGVHCRLGVCLLQAGGEEYSLQAGKGEEVPSLLNSFLFCDA